MNLQRAAEIQVVLEGISLPATRAQLVDYAALYDQAASNELRLIPDREYRRIDEVAEELVATQALRPRPQRLPKPESGTPPGGDDYLRPFPEPGAVSRG